MTPIAADLQPSLPYIVGRYVDDRRACGLDHAQRFRRTGDRARLVRDFDGLRDRFDARGTRIVPDGFLPWSRSLNVACRRPLASARSGACSSSRDLAGVGRRGEAASYTTAMHLLCHENLFERLF